MKPANPDKMIGISDHVYLLQARQLTLRELKALKRQDIARIVIKERKISQARSRTVSIQAELNRRESRNEKPITINDLLADITI